MLRLLMGKDWTANRDVIFFRLASDIRQRKPGRILLVPELISHEMERRLCMDGGDTASRYAEVLSFTRLARRVEDEMGHGEECLDPGGRLVAMAAAARQLHSRLKAYASVETKPEFLTGLIDCMDEFKRCCIRSADLRMAAAATEGSFSQKLEELSLLMEAYDGICARGKRDPRDQETLLLEQLADGDFGENHVFYVEGFPDFTRQHLAILEHLIRVSPEVTIAINCDTPGSDRMAFEKAGATAREILKIAGKANVQVIVEQIPGRQDALAPVREKLFQGAIVPGCMGDVLQVFRAESEYEECMAAAEEILAGIRRGNRYRDYTVVCTDMATGRNLIRLIFGRMGIPVYQSGTEDILQKNVVSTVLYALEAMFSGFAQRETLRYLRAGLTPLEPDICDDVENYVAVWGIRGKQWMEPWQNHPDGLGEIWTEERREKLHTINTARAQAMEPLFRLEQGFRNAKNLREQVLALYAFLEDIRLEERLTALALEMDAAGDNRSAQILNQLWEILLSALEQLHDVLGETVWEPEHFGRLLRLLLSQYDVGTIPPVLDAVQFGPISAMRCHQQKHLIVLGAQEGKLPGYTGSTGVLTDRERVALRKLGVPLTGGSLEGIQAEFADIYGVFSGAEESIRVYYSGDQPGFVCRRLAEMAGGEEKAKICLGYAQSSPEEAGAYLARWDGTETARELGVEGHCRDTCRRRDYAMGAVSRENIEAIYGKTLNLSASQVDRQAQCRLSYFLKYGLRVRERKEATVDPAEFGTYVHAVLEKTAREIQEKGGFHRVSREETLAIAHRHSDAYAAEHFAGVDSERLRYLFLRNGQELDMVVAELWQELQTSLFEPRAFEVNFGSANGLPPIAVPNGAMHTVLRGFIDRMDTWEENGNTYYRVVDYKTGRKDFDYCDVFNGVGLQMLIYLFALKHSGTDLLGQRPVAAGVQYFPARAPYIRADGRLEDDQAEALREKEWKRRGLLLLDEDVLHAMEPVENPTRLDIKRKKDGTLEGDLATREQLKLLESYLFRVLGKMVEDIASGNVEPNPYTRGTGHDACAWCPYGTICHRETVQGRRNYKTMTAQWFWEAVEKEMHHGR